MGTAAKHFLLIITAIVALNAPQGLQAAENILLGNWDVGEGCNKFQAVFMKDGTFHYIRNTEGNWITDPRAKNGTYTFSADTFTMRFQLGEKDVLMENKFVKIKEGHFLQVNIPFY